MIAESQPFAPSGNTITLTANISGSLPTPVQCTTPAGGTQQYIITNIGANPAFISYGPTSDLATSNCVVPTATPTNVIPMLPTSQSSITLPPNSWFCGITSSGTSIIYITPGIGV